MEPLFSISILPLTMRLTMVSQLLPFGTRTDGRRFKDTHRIEREGKGGVYWYWMK